MTLPSRLHSRIFGLVLAALSLGACSRVTEPTGAPAELQTLPRDLTSTEVQLVDASNAFSFALWSKVAAAQRDSNVFISPLSASFALGMTLDGAANATFDQMRTALQLGGVSQPDINSGYKSLMALLTSLDPSVTMRIANSIWYRQGFPFDQSFLDDARTYFDAEVQGLNFDDAAGTLAAVNGWVNLKTNGKIPTILDEVTSDDVMFLINALYFKGSWRERFDPGRTTHDLFTTTSGTTQPVSLMHRDGVMPYGETATYQAVDLPYGNGAFTMTVLLPRAGTDIETLSSALTATSWRALVPTFETEVDLALPKFRMSFDRILNDDLKALGMTEPFIADGADFTRMSSEGRRLYISIVKQKTYVDVNEEGTEAAAVTSVGVKATSASPSKPVMRVDHPFLFVIRERLSGTVLFMGKVARIPS
jgi:serpin B